MICKNTYFVNFILGTVANYALNPNRMFEDYSRPYIPGPALDQNTSPESYIGNQADKPPLIFIY